MILKKLGVGGDIPVTIVLKQKVSSNTELASTYFNADEGGLLRVSGCLILQFGEVIILRPLRPSESVKDCVLRMRGSSESPPKPLSQVIRIASSDVLEVRPFESSPAQSK